MVNRRRRDDEKRAAEKERQELVEQQRQADINRPVNIREEYLKMQKKELAAKKTLILGENDKCRRHGCGLKVMAQNHLNMQIECTQVSFYGFL